ncbi:MAG TPA: serine protease [Candidatus Paceibacterota bacterium]|nr:serine protease [Candidatus Paceibacterota bacterium]
MNFHDLTKWQFILLNVLVSAVVSLAVVVLVVSFLDGRLDLDNQPKQNLSGTGTGTSTQTANGSSTESTPAGKAAAQKEQLTLDVGQKGLESVVEVYAKTAAGKQQTGIGFFVSPNEVLVGTDELSSNTVISYQGNAVSAQVIARDDGAGIALLKAELPGNSPKPSPAMLSSSAVELGERVVALGGENGYSILTGNVTGMIPSSSSGAFKNYARIQTDISWTHTPSGAPVFDTDGNAIGIHVASNSNGSYTLLISKDTLRQLEGSAPQNGH